MNKQEQQLHLYPNTLPIYRNYNTLTMCIAEMWRRGTEHAWAIYEIAGIFESVYTCRHRVVGEWVMELRIKATFPRVDKPRTRKIVKDPMPPWRRGGTHGDPWNVLKDVLERLRDDHVNYASCWQRLMFAYEWYYPFENRIPEYGGSIVNPKLDRTRRTKYEWKFVRHFKLKNLVEA